VTREISKFGSQNLKWRALLGHLSNRPPLQPGGVADNKDAVVIVWVFGIHGIVLDIATQVQPLGIALMLVWVEVIWGHEAAPLGGVEAGAEVVEAGFGIAFFAGELVAVVAAVDVG
jgi:hypothetical protein